MRHSDTIKALAEAVEQAGAYKTGVVAVKEIPFEAEFRKACESNACGMYGRSWMCPPHVGEINALIEQAKGYEWALVYQTVGELEDSYDIEGMLEAGQKMNALTQVVRGLVQTSGLNAQETLHLGAGGCRVCERCAKFTDEPCRFPEKAVSSLEAYGVSVSQLAQLCDMKYINGQDTVTYFGAVLLR